MRAVPELRHPSALFLTVLLTPWIAIPAIVAFLFAAVDHFFAVLALFVLGPAWALSAIIAAVWCGYLIWKRACRLGIFALILPVTLLLSPWKAIEAPVYVGDVIRFVTAKSSYDRQVALRPQNHIQLVEFNWGGMLFASDGVVYDETDEISLPKDHRSAAWQARERNTDLMCGKSDLIGPIQPLWGHYYLAHFGC